MQAWGVAGGGPKNAQAISDIVAYLLTIQLSPEDAKAQATKALAASRADSGACPAYMVCPGITLTAAEEALGIEAWPDTRPGASEWYELMKRFYTGLLQRHLPAATALRQAQRDMAADPRWAAPYYWAGFVIQGDWLP